MSAQEKIVIEISGLDGSKPAIQSAVNNLGFLGSAAGKAGIQITAVWAAFEVGKRVLDNISNGLKKVWETLELGAKADQQSQAFDRMAASYGKNSKAILAQMKETSGGTLDTMRIIEKAGTAMMMGISPEKLGSLMQIARMTSRQTGQDVSQAFSDIALAVGRQSRMILDNLGIIVDVEEANKRYARELGKTASDLTDVERKTAFLNETIRKGGDLVAKLGSTSATSGEMMQKMGADVSDMASASASALTRFLTPNLEAVAGWLTKIADLSKRAYAPPEGGTYGASAMIEFMERQRSALQEQLGPLQDVAAGSGMFDRALSWIPGYKTAEEAQQQVAILERQIELITRTIERTREQAEAAKRAGEANQQAAETAARAWGVLGDSLAGVEEKTIKQALDMYKSLYDQTGMQIYADRALEIHRKMLDEKEKEWRKYVWYEDDIRILRENEETKFRNSVLGLTQDFVDREREIEEQRLDSTRDILDRQLEMERGAANQRALAQDWGDYSQQWGTTGMKVTIYTPPKTTQQTSSSYGSAWTAASIPLLSAQRTSNALDALEDQLAEQQRDAQRFYSQVAQMMAQMEQRSWQLEDWQNQYATLLARAQTSPAGESWYDDTIQTFEDILDAIRQIDTIEQGQLKELQRQTVQYAEYGSAGESLGNFLSGLATGALAPVESAQAMAEAYSSMLASARASAGEIPAFVQFVQGEFLPWMKSYTAAGPDYQAVYDTVSATMEAMEGLINVHKLRLYPEDIIQFEGMMNVNVGELLNLSEQELKAKLDLLANAITGVGSGAELASPALQTTESRTGMLKGALYNAEAVMGDMTDETIGMSESVRQRLTEVANIFNSVVANMVASVQNSGQSSYTPPSSSIGGDSGGDTPQKYPYTFPWVHTSNYSWGQPGKYMYVWTTQAPGYAGVQHLTWPNGEPPEPVVVYMQHGGLIDRQIDMVRAGEKGAEWFVPTYEPERSRFLKDVGADPDRIGEAVARRLGPMLLAGGGEGGGPMQINVRVGEKAFAEVLINALRHDGQVVEEVRRIVRR